ncbi:MAG: esterase-like activity of phytase family protein [Desulfobacteraceae bacterium]
MTRGIYRRKTQILGAVAVVCSVVAFGLYGTGRSSQLECNPVPKSETVACEFLGTVNYPTGLKFQGLEVGGLSGISFFPAQNMYYAVSDDRGQKSPARVFTLTIDFADGRLDQGDIVLKGVIVLKDEKGKPFKRGSIDPEGIAVAETGEFYISSEGDVDGDIDPFIGCFDANGQLQYRLPIPEKFMPGKHKGVRDNRAFESLALSRDGRYLYTATENALKQDGPKTGFKRESHSRILKYDVKQRQPVGEFVYRVEHVSEPKTRLHGPGTNGLADLLVFDKDGDFLSIERSYTLGDGFVVKLFRISAKDAVDVSAQYGLFDKDEELVFDVKKAVQKTEMADVSMWVKDVDNIEGITMGPALPDGRSILIMVSDNNFSRFQKTQFIAIAITDCLITGRVL